MAQLSAREMLKYEWRPEVFIRKLEERSEFQTRTGKVRLVAPTNYKRDLTSGNPGVLRDMQFAGEDGNVYKLTDFVKTAEFGGKGEGSGTIKEDRELASLKKQIADIKKETGHATVPIKIGSDVYYAFDAVSTPGTPKSDFHLIDVDGKEIVWISHKDGSKAKDFQQWGGLSQRVEPKIHRHRETQDFAKTALKVFGNKIPPKTTVARKITDRQLKMMAVYGNEYGRPFSRQHVQLTIQGPVKLKKITGGYRFDSNHIHLSGQDMKGEYEPVFMMIYKGDRSDLGVKGARAVIAPVGCRKITGWL